MPELTIPQMIAVWALPVLFAITVHEVAHGWVASKLGDKTALMLGRLTLNPIKHIDPIGTILVPAVLLFLGGFIFGWAKPVPVNWQNLRRPRLDMALVAAAGPIANLLMALLWAGIAKFGLWYGHEHFPGALAIVYMGQAGIMINLVLMILNFLPIPPLDGGHVLSALLPGRWSVKLDYLAPYGFFVLLALLILGVLQHVLAPPVFFLQGTIVQLFGL